MNVIPESSRYYRDHYLQRVSEQNRRLFTSPYVWQFQPGDLPLNPRKLSADGARTFLEIGFGHGEVLEALIPQRGDTVFIGIERRPARVRKTIKRLQRIHAGHARLIRINLELYRDGLFVPESFDEILINHPDPWPKKRHAHHRFFKRAALTWLKQLLVPGGTLEVASDHTAYFFQILRLFEEDDELVSLLPPPFYTAQPLEGRPMSRYELKKRRAGQTVRILRFRRL